MIKLKDIYESILREGKNHPIIVVDVQPAYRRDGDEIFDEIVEYVAASTGDVLMFVNAEDTGLTSDSISDVKMYWESVVCGDLDDRYDFDVDEYTECDEIDWRRFEIVDKGYGYFRAWMDQDVDPHAIIQTIREMYQQKVTDSRELFDGEDSDDYIAQMEDLGIPEEVLGDPLSVEWTSVSQLKEFSGAYIVGGGRNECLREVELLMNAFNIKYKRIDSLVYG